MAGNTIGQLFQLTSFGESHGTAIGGIVDGCPAGLELDLRFIQAELDRRKPGQSKIVSQRKESDQVQFLSGIVLQGKYYTTTGTPIGFIILNEDSRSKDYDHLKNVFRPSHADFTYSEKYGIRDHKGGGRSSARETAVRVVAGAIAKLILKRSGIELAAFVSQAGNVTIASKNTYLQSIRTKKDVQHLIANTNNIVRCPDKTVAKEMIALIEKTKKQGDTIGGIISCVVTGVPAGLGEPVFDKLHADLGKAMLSINAVKGFEYGSGFEGTTLRGSEHNDVFAAGKNKTVKTITNHSGGIQGGISNGETIYFNTAFKPVATIMKDQETLNTRGQKVKISGKGRHDPCVLPRAVPIVEAMTAMVLVDHLLRSKTARL